MSQISLAPFVTALAPLINALVMSVVGSAIIYAVALLHRKTGIDISAAHVDAIRKGANYLHSSFRSVAGHVLRYGLHSHALHPQILVRGKHHLI